MPVPGADGGEIRKQVHDLQSALLQQRCGGLDSPPPNTWLPVPEVALEGNLIGPLIPPDQVQSCLHPLLDAKTFT